ncbi:MAG: SRPBCC domain-containing protein [Anaerolineales bacterium]|nr:SRPBCC domain-containing protein [Anaerolineales bacterium]
MPGKADFLKYKQIINSTPSEAYRAFTSPTALNEWLCDQAEVKAQPTRSYYFWWQNGYSACGEYTELTPEKTVGFTWLGKDDPDKTYVHVTIKPKPEGVQVILIHGGIGNGNKWKSTRRQIDQGWQVALENLKTALEIGQDQRLLRRPMMGILGVQELNEETAKQHNFPKTKGLYLIDVLEGMGAKNAGLQSGDILVKMGGRKLSKPQNIADIIGEHKVGDKVKVVYYRQGEKQNTELTFSERLHFDIPPQAKDLAAQVDAMYKPLVSQLEQTLKGISDEKASKYPAPEEWNIKQVLAHLIASEKDTHFWIAAMIEDQDSGFNFHVNKTERLNAILEVCPTLSSLIKDLKRNIAETVALLSNLPESFVAHKRTYNQLGEFLSTTTYHYQDHFKQIQKIIDA